VPDLLYDELKNELREETDEYGMLLKSFINSYSKAVKDEVAARRLFKE
jgi:hypothetical protein